VIVTVTPNPSIDRTVLLGRLERGALNRATGVTAEAAGKGLNVARALRQNGVDTLAVFPLAEESAAAYLSLLDGAVPTMAVPVAGSVRVNLSLLESDGTITKVNEPGPVLAEGDASALVRAADVPDAQWIVGCGSLPPGMPSVFYAELVALRSGRRRVAIDTSGAPLREAVQARPDLVKPNVAELEELAGSALPTLGGVCDAAASLVAEGVATALVSLGADGALLVDGSGAAHAEARVRDVVNTVGAGDALLAGYLASDGGRSGLRMAVAWSAAAVRSAGTLMGSLLEEDMAAVTMAERIDRSRVLHR